MIVMMGIDGIYTDFVCGTFHAFNLIGSQSKLFLA